MENNIPKIICIGDSVIDIYQNVNYEKFSKEYPLPIIHSTLNDEETFPGGCSNVAYQFKYFNVDVFLLTFFDDKLEKILCKEYINHNFSVKLTSGYVPRKIRCFNKNLPVLRHDIEEKNYKESNIETLRNELFNNFKKLISEEKIDVVIMSDYDKGVFDFNLCQNLIQECKKNNIITIVDPKLGPLKKWEGCDIFKLNSSEAKELSSLENIADQINYIQNQINCKYVIVTNEGNGFYFKELYKELITYSPVRKNNEVNNVIGAGDLFAALIAKFTCVKKTVYESCVMAFAGCTEYVKSHCNYPITDYEILKQIDKSKAKIIKLFDFFYLKSRKFKDKKIVFTNGCFDIIHSAHVDLLRFCKSQGDILVVGINSDESIKKLKGENRPILSLDDRCKILSSMEDVDFIIVYSEDTPFEILNIILPDVLVKGGDYKLEEIVGHDIVKNTLIFPYQQGNSTSNIIDKIKQDYSLVSNATK
jgi:D-beta-D-heptose 7-phosphate kinase/D-beta-D-heptose 1-phosphate adenosyltransferase